MLRSRMFQGRPFESFFAIVCTTIVFACSNEETSPISEQNVQAGGSAGASGSANQGGTSASDQGGQSGSNQAGASGTSSEEQTLLACWGGTTAAACAEFSGNVVDLKDIEFLRPTSNYVELAIFEGDCPSPTELGFHQYPAALNTQVIASTEEFEPVSGLPSSVGVAVFLRTAQCETIAFGCSSSTLPNAKVIAVDVSGIYTDGKLSPIAICEEGIACNNGACAKLLPRLRTIGVKTIIVRIPSETNKNPPLISGRGLHHVVRSGL